MPGEHGGGCSCRDEATALGLGQAKWLNGVISMDQVVALNVVDGDIKAVMKKRYDQRTQDELGFIQSDSPDNELLIHIPFDSPVTLASVFVIGGEGVKHPRIARLYANPSGGSGADFSDMQDREPTQKLELAEDLCGAVEYPVKTNKFMNIVHLAIYLDPADEENDGGPKDVFWIGLKGIATEWKRQAVETVYESAANAADHEAPEDAFGTNSIA